MIIRIIGSMAFSNEFDEAKEYLESKGHTVLLPKRDSLPEPIPPKQKLRTMIEFNEDLEKSDCVLVMNYSKRGKSNHIGVNTLMEIGMAFNRGKKIIILRPIPEFCQHELEAIGCKVLGGNLDKV